MNQEPKIDAPIPNPAGNAFNVSVLVPEQISIRMVDASSLADYEYHLYAASLLFGLAVGFLVPCAQEFRSGGDLAIPFLLMTMVILGLFVGAMTMAVKIRKKLTRSGREIKLTTTAATL
ncbi:hypothetical protein HFO41_24960 [Rhizobium leguminosarum]|uniref:hypothetical protein n=1 Tax=Rhizobium leguminosarum TaxID=384 RepID=UPI001C981174|nr:hypothetical protein [Rhizobium leguminosarum]MBY5692036.1 hypothetical protein [Rhizobium leguminosarum]